VIYLSHLLQWLSIAAFWSPKKVELVPIIDLHVRNSSISLQSCDEVSNWLLTHLVASKSQQDSLQLVQHAKIAIVGTFELFTPSGTYKHTCHPCTIYQTLLAFSNQLGCSQSNGKTSKQAMYQTKSYIQYIIAPLLTLLRHQHKQSQRIPDLPFHGRTWKPTRMDELPWQ